MDELDIILLEQHHSAKARLKRLRRLLKIMSQNKQLMLGEQLIIKKLQFLENHMIDKHLLNKKQINKISFKRSFLHFLYDLKFFYFYRMIFSRKKK
jgi:hypothetical protein